MSVQNVSVLSFMALMCIVMAWKNLSSGEIFTFSTTVYFKTEQESISALHDCMSVTSNVSKE